MAIQSIGVGSGLDLNSLVSQLLEAERKPKIDRLDAREKTLDDTISGVGKLLSKMSGFKTAVDKLSNENQLNNRKAVTTHPTSSSADNNSTALDPFTAEASSSAPQGKYNIAIEQLASGSRVQTNDGDFASSSASVLGAGSGSLTFKIPGSSQTFDVNVTAGMTLDQLKNAVNSASGNSYAPNASNPSDTKPFVTASIINTGTASGAKLVFTSAIAGDGKDLRIVNNGDLADLNKVATHNSTETTTLLSPVQSAQNAKATIDGIAVESSTNKFENVIANVAFTAQAVSPKDAADPTKFRTSTLEIGADKEGVKKNIEGFVKEYNSLVKELKTLTRYGSSALEDDGALAGDFMARGIESRLGNIVSSSVSSSKLGTLFGVGITFNTDGELEITSADSFGGGAKRLDSALEDNFDEIAKLFTDPKEGIAARLSEVAKQYTTTGGLLKSREQSLKDEKREVQDERGRVELQLLNYEQLLKKRYTGLDQTVARLNQTQNALVASLGSLR